jgi:hypothetical protein
LFWLVLETEDCDASAAVEAKTEKGTVIAAIIQHLWTGLMILVEIP